MCSSIHSNGKGVALSLWVQVACGSHQGLYLPRMCRSGVTGFYSRHTEQENPGEDDQGIKVLQNPYWHFWRTSLVSNLWTREAGWEKGYEAETGDSLLRGSLCSGLSGKRQHDRLKEIQVQPTFTERQSQGLNSGWVTTPKANCLAGK